jgi:NAD(P)-dependent dehydrogenase (short-subunit alcohol dehydrogenase family)
MSHNVEGKVVVMTGASSGLGEARLESSLHRRAPSHALNPLVIAELVFPQGRKPFMNLFEGKVALVTGAGGGIGLATASAFAEAGASVIID